MFEWPMISFDNRVYHPVFGDSLLILKLQDFGVKYMQLDPDFTFDGGIGARCSVVNSKREIVNVAQNPHEEEAAIMIFKSSGESKALCKVPKEDDVPTSHVLAMDIDAKDNIYVIAAFNQEGLDRPGKIKLFIFCDNGDKKHDFPLPFQYITGHVPIAISQDGKIAIFDPEGKTLYIGNICDKLNFDISFHLKEISSEWVHIRYLNARIFAIDTFNNVYIYTDSGHLKRKFEIPRGQAFIKSVAINHVTQRIFVKKGRELFNFSTGEIIDSLFLGGSSWIGDAVVVPHPNGTVALVGKGEIAFLQL